MVKKSDLMLKEVIDINQGKKLGYIEDVDIDINNGNVTAVIVPGAAGIVFRLFSKKQDIVIAWDNIEKIGEDVILVNV